MHAAPTCHTPAAARPACARRCACGAFELRTATRTRTLPCALNVHGFFTGSQLHRNLSHFHLTKIDDFLKSRCLRSSPFAMV